MVNEAHKQEVYDAILVQTNNHYPPFLQIAKDQYGSKVI
jgi:hypothetical protein